MSEINVRPGDPITADLLMRIANRESAAGIRASGGITARQGADGSIQLHGSFTGVFTGQTTSTITARSGASLGTGTVEIYVKNPATGNYVDSGLSVAVDSVSSTSGGVPSGTWVTCGYQDDGTPTLLNVDCGN